MTRELSVSAATASSSASSSASVPIRRFSLYPLHAPTIGLVEFPPNLHYAFPSGDYHPGYDQRIVLVPTNFVFLPRLDPQSLPPRRAPFVAPVERLGRAQYVPIQAQRLVARDGRWQVPARGHDRPADRRSRDYYRRGHCYRFNEGGRGGRGDGAGAETSARG